MMAGRPAKSLAAHLRDGTFRARRESHRALLLGPELPWQGFAVFQGRYRSATSEPERRAVALEFERAVQLVQEQARRERAGGGRSLGEELAMLGKAGTPAQLVKFFPYYLAHPKGPKLGQPFRLEPWQQAFLREFYRRDRRDRRVYRSGVLGVPRGNGKTPLAAGLGLYELVTRTDAPEVYFAAGSKEQAGIALEFARPFVEQGQLVEWVDVKTSLLLRGASRADARALRRRQAATRAGARSRNRRRAVGVRDQPRGADVHRALLSAAQTRRRLSARDHDRRLRQTLAARPHLRSSTRLA
jgi:hypothetical protein